MGRNYKVPPTQMGNKNLKVYSTFLFIRKKQLSLIKQSDHIKYMQAVGKKHSCTKLVWWRQSDDNPAKLKMCIPEV